MRCGDDQAEERCVSRRSALPDEVCRDDRLPMPGRERVRHAPEERCAERRGDHPEAELISTDERGEAGVGYAVRCPQSGSARYVRTCPRDCPWNEGCSDSRDVQGTREEVFRVGAKLVTPARHRTDEHFLPADSVRIVRVSILDLA